MEKRWCTRKHFTAIQVFFNLAILGAFLFTRSYILPTRKPASALHASPPRDDLDGVGRSTGPADVSQPYDDFEGVDRSAGPIGVSQPRDDLGGVGKSAGTVVGTSQPRDDLGGVGGSIGPVGVFPRARPRVVHNMLFGSSSCSDKAAYVRQHRGGAVVVEVGAYLGEELAQFKGLVKRLYTYEPSKSKHKAIRAAIAAAGMKDVVTMRPVAVSDANGEAMLQMAKAEGTQQDSLGEIGFM